MTNESVADQVANMIPRSDESEQDTAPKILNRSGEPVNSAEEKTDEAREDVDERLEEANVQGLDPATAEVLANMQEEINRLRQDTQTVQRMAKEDEGGPSGFPWQYYKRPGGGVASEWVVFAPGGSAGPGKGRDSGAFAHYVAKGMKALMGYGICNVPSDTRTPGVNFITMLNNGGAREFPATQVLAYKWHLEPPIAGLKFPQYEAIKGTELDFACEECDLELYFLPEDEVTPRSCFNHLRTQHGYGRQEASLTLRTQGITNVAPHAIRAAAEAVRVDDGFENYPDRKKAID